MFPVKVLQQDNVYHTYNPARIGFSSLKKNTALYYDTTQYFLDNKLSTSSLALYLFITKDNRVLTPYELLLVISAVVRIRMKEHFALIYFASFLQLGPDQVLFRCYYIVAKHGQKKDWHVSDANFQNLKQNFSKR